MSGPAKTACLSPEDVREYLAGSREDSAAALRAIEGHLDGCSECRRLISAVALVGSGSSAPSEVVTQPIGRPRGDPLAFVHDRWTPVGVIAQGGMGVVLRVRPVGGGAALALKRISQGRHHPQALPRFAREAELLGRLDHPNIVRLVDVLVETNGEIDLVMELLEGEDLGTRLRRGPLPPAEVARVGAQAAEGLSAAHAIGIVHRDVKPSNLFCCADGTVKVLDFGLASIAEAEIAPRITEAGAVLGTPAYMSSEQVRAGETDARTDVWGLGSTLYHALAGRPPFGNASATAVLTRIASGAPDPLPPGTPPRLAAVLLRAMAREPAARWQTMRELADAIRASVAPAAPSAGDEPAPPGAAAEPDGLPLAEEVRLVAALIAEGLQGGRTRYLVEQAVRRRDGAPVWLPGGRIVALFGASGWLGDEPERAVAAALEASEVATRVAVGIGRATWRAEAPETVTGAAVEAAEQVLPAARPVAACPETLRRILGGFEVDGARVLGPRGPARPVHVREVGGIEIPMVGRDAELEELLTLVARTRAEQRAGAALVVGVAGIGKSRLRLEVHRRLEAEREPPVCLLMRSDSSARHRAWAAAASLVRTWAGLPAGSGPDARAALERFVGASEVPPETAAMTAGLLGVLLAIPFPDDPQIATARREREVLAGRLRQAIGDVLECWARRRPVVLFVEDAHWIDDASLGLVDQLVGRLAALPFALVATARPELLAHRPGVLSRARRIELSELPARALEQIVSSILGRAEPAITRRAAGTPYLAEELALAVRDGADPEALPTSAEAAVRARLDRLPQDERELLKRAAVLGDRFDPPGLEALGQHDTAAILQRLQRRGLVEPRFEAVGGAGGCWGHRHAIVREVVAASLTSEQGVTLHRAAGSWLARSPEAAPDEVAQHFDRADDPERAASYWLLAARLAHRRGDAAAALVASERVLTAAAARPLAPTEEHELRLARCEALTWLGRHGEEAAELEQLRALEARSASAGQPLGAAACAETRRRASLYLGRRGRARESLDAAREALALAPRDDAATAAQCGVALTMALLAIGEQDEAVGEAERTVALAERSADAVAISQAEGVRALTLGAQGKVCEALEANRRAARAAEACGSMRLGMHASNIGWALSTLGDLDGAERELTKAIVEGHRVGQRMIEGYALQNLALVLARKGQTESGIAAATRALWIADETAQPRLAVGALCHRSTIRTEAGDCAAALADAEEALRRTLDAGLGGLDAICRTARAMALRGLGRLDEAEADCAHAVQDRDRAGGMEELEIELFVLAHRLYAERGDDDEAGQMLARAERARAEQASSITDPVARERYARSTPALRFLARQGGVS